MKIKLILITVLIVLFSSILFWFYNQGKKEEKFNQLQQINENQNEIIKEQKTVAKRKAINLGVSSDDNFSFLQQNCSDC